MLSIEGKANGAGISIRVVRQQYSKMFIPGKQCWKEETLGGKEGLEGECAGR